MNKWFSFWTWLFMIACHTAVLAQNNPRSDAASTLRDFLSHPPISWNCQLDVQAFQFSDGGKPTMLEMVVKGESFCFKNTSSKNRFLIGRNELEIWELHDNVLTTRSFGSNPTSEHSTNYLLASVASADAAINNVITMGMFLIKPGSVSWSENTFSAKTPFGEDVRGRLELDPNEIPKSLVYVENEHSETVHYVELHYSFPDTNNLILPRGFTSYYVGGGKTNYWSHVNLYTFNLNPETNVVNIFSSSNYLGQEHIFKAFFSNDVEYLQRANPRRPPVAIGSGSHLKKAGGEGRKLMFVIRSFIFFILLAPLFGYLVFRLRKQVK